MFNHADARDNCILEKYIHANEVRALKNQAKKEISERKIYKKQAIKKSTEMLKQLEEKALIAWKDREKDRFYSQLKKKSADVRNSFFLHRKVLKIAISQEEKLIRKDRSGRPKVDPLPYLKKAKERLYDSMDMESEKEVERNKSTMIAPAKKFEIVVDPRSKIKVLLGH